MSDAAPATGRPGGSRPAPSADALARPRLASRLHRAPAGQVTTLVAPAGFGKTTLLAQALDARLPTSGRRVAWVTCDGAHGDADRLAHDVSRALGHQRQGEPWADLLDGSDVCLVVDDVGRIPAGSCGERWLAELIDKPSAAHVVLSGRREPAVPLARRRAAGRVTDLRAGDLAFTPAEVAAVVAGTGLAFDDRELTALGGWPALVDLALDRAPRRSGTVPPGGRRVARPDGGAALVALAALGRGRATEIERVAGIMVDVDATVDALPLVHRDPGGWYRCGVLWSQLGELAFDPWERIGASHRARTAAVRRPAPANLPSPRPDPAPTEPAAGSVRIEVLGELRVVGPGGRPVELRRQRVRALLELLVVAGPLRRERIVDLLWPDLDAAAGARNLRVTLSRLRDEIGPSCCAVHHRTLALQADGEVIALGPPGTIEVDAWQFRAEVATAHVSAARGDLGGAMAALEHACSRWRGEPCADLGSVGDMTTAVEAVRLGWRDATLWLGELLLTAGRFDEAARWAARLLAAFPGDERSHRLRIASDLQRDDHDAVAASVTALRGALRALAMEPEPATAVLLHQVDLHERVVAGRRSA